MHLNGWIARKVPWTERDPTRDSNKRFPVYFRKVNVSFQVKSLRIYASFLRDIFYFAAGIGFIDRLRDGAIGNPRDSSV